ncbi:hypothetical protein V1264_005041 [Littorina saxatilis]|uniref:Uncharacterized protein n=1 Tax=Littorina saxatilis TaxID=31220 RepID=A0AAN9AYF2_9CAEN
MNRTVYTTGQSSVWINQRASRETRDDNRYASFIQLLSSSSNSLPLNMDTCTGEVSGRLGVVLYKLQTTPEEK